MRTGITFISYAQSGKPNNLSDFGSKKTKKPNQNGQNQLLLPMARQGKP